MAVVAGVVLAGGRSSRMGAPKAGLDWHGGTLLGRVAGVLRRAVDGPLVVVAAPGQEVMGVPAGTVVARDPVAGVGPLQGIAGGLAAAEDHGADHAFVCATDLPLLHPAVVRRIVRALTVGIDAAVPVADGHVQPLAAAYRCALAGQVARWVAGGERRAGVVADRASTVRLTPDDLLADTDVREVDPELRSLRNVNDPADHRAALALPLPVVTVRGDVPAGPCSALTVAGLLAGIGRSVDDVEVRVGGRVVGDPALALVGGDMVELTVRRPRGADR